MLLDEEQEKRSALEKIDARVKQEIDEATDLAEQSPMPEAGDALAGIYADPAVTEPLWFREGVRSAVAQHERPASWGTFNG